MAREIHRPKDRSMLTMFIILSLSLLIGIEGFALGNLFKVTLITVTIFIQAVILKNIMDDYYQNM